LQDGWPGDCLESVFCEKGDRLSWGIIPKTEIDPKITQIDTDFEEVRKSDRESF
jgi:hypothetical protein